VLNIGERRIEVLPAVHTVPAVGFAVLHDAGAWVFTGDTGPNPALWQRLRTLQIAHLVIETAFSDEERALAKISSHLCPATLGGELKHLEGSIEVHITHIKPGEVEAVMGQIEALGSRHRISALASGQALEIGNP
jgi:ribonuclease BN (tRNA processing enzyme)